MEILVIVLSSKEEVLKRVDPQKNTLIFDSNPPLDIMGALAYMRRGYKWGLYAVGRHSSLSPSSSQSSDIINLNIGQSYKFDFPKMDRGYILNVNAIFNNPNGTLKFRLDKWAFDASPLNLRMIRNVPVPTSNWYIYLGTWAPMTPYGPMYGLTLDPIAPIPITGDTSIEVSNPTTSVMSKVECGILAVGLIQIDNYVEFLDEWQKVKAEFLTGSEGKNWENRRK